MNTLFAFFTLLVTVPSAFSAFPAVRLQFSSGQVVDTAWVAGPTTQGESILRLEWKTSSDGQAAEPSGEVNVALFMPEMGHGSRPTRIRQVLDDRGQPLSGVYEVTSMYFIMGGSWEVRVTLKGRDGRVETQAFRVTPANR